MRVTAGILGIIGSVAVLWMGAMAFLAGGMLIALPIASEIPRPTPEPFQVGMMSLAAGALALAFSVVILARRMPRTSSGTLVVAGLIALLFQNVFGVIVIVAGLLGIAAYLISRRTDRRLQPA